MYKEYKDESLTIIKGYLDDSNLSETIKNEIMAIISNHKRINENVIAETKELNKDTLKKLKNTFLILKLTICIQLISIIS